MAISTKTQATKRQHLDGRSVTDIIYYGDSVLVTSDHIAKIPKHTFKGKDNNSIAEFKNLKLVDQTGSSIAKWTEPRNIDLGQPAAWLKLKGISSPGVPRPITILGGNPFATNQFDDSGVFIPGAPIQTNDSGEASKINITGVGTEAILVLQNVEHSNFEDYGGYALYPSIGKHVYISPNGVIYLFVSMKSNGSTRPRVNLGFSSTGGRFWTWVELDPTWNVHQDAQNMTADIDGNLHLTWLARDGDTGTTLDPSSIIYAKLNIKTNVISKQTISVNANQHGFSPMIGLRPDGRSVEIMWCSMGYGSNPAYPNIISRVVNSDLSLGSIVVLTTDGVEHSYPRYVSFVYDSLGYRHIAVIYSAHDNTLLNGYYIYETSGGWQPRILINSNGSDPNNMHYISNILIDKKDVKYVVYDIGPFDRTSKNPIYIKKIVNGSLGARTVVQAGNPNMGGTVPQIQVNEDGYILVIFMSNTSPDTFQYRKLSPIDLTVLENVTIYTAPAGTDLSYFQTAWGIPPSIQNVYPNVPKQGIMMISADYLTADPTYANIRMFFNGNVVMGATNTFGVATRTVNIRGSINKTKLNNMANPAIS